MAGSREGAALRRSIKIERYAEVLAHVVHFGADRAEEVVRRFGLTLDGWRAIDEAWSEDLAEAIRRNQQDLALRFSATFARRRRRLAREQPALSAVGDAAPVGTPSEASAAPSGAGAPQVAVPSFMAASRAAERPEPASVGAPGGMAAPGAAAVAFGAAPSEPPPAPAAAAVTPAAPEKPTTQAMPAVPQGTEPLPFAGGVAPDVALRAALDHAENVQGPRPAKGPSLGVTAPSEGERIAAIARRILPFQPAGGAREAGARESDPGPPPGAPTPVGEGGAGLTLEQHASLHVELGLHPEQRSAILRRYGLAPEQHARLDAGWQAKIAQDPAVRSAWEGACARYRAWLLRNKPQAPG